MGRRRRGWRAPPLEDFPFVWDREVRPAGHKGERCKIIGRKGKGQGLCQIEFRGGGTFLVQRKGLRKVGS